MDFNPWNDYKNCDERLSIDVPEPLCKECRFWKPRIVTDRLGAYDGVVLCTKENMYHDFSCYKPREEK